MSEFVKFDIRPVLEHYGAGNLPTKRGWAAIKCVVHDDSSPSASFSEVDNKFHCFSCGFHGDALDIIQAKEGGDLATAIERAKEITGSDGVQPDEPSIGRRKPARLSDRGTQSAAGRASGAGNGAAVRGSTTSARRRPRRITG